MRPVKLLRDQSGSIRQGLMLLVVIIVIALFFWIIDSIDRKQNNSTDEFMQSNADTEEPVFDDARVSAGKRDDGIMASPREEVTETDVDPAQDPALQETNAQNAFYKPLSHEKKRIKEQRLQNKPTR